MTVNIEKLTLPVGLDREGIRRYVIERFLDEKPGTSEEQERYQYIVEECESR